MAKSGTAGARKASPAFTTIWHFCQFCHYLALFATFCHCGAGTGAPVARSSGAKASTAFANIWHFWHFCHYVALFATIWHCGAGTGAPAARPSGAKANPAFASIWHFLALFATIWHFLPLFATAAPGVDPGSHRVPVGNSQI